MIDGALWAVIALAVAVVVYVELRIRAVKKATGTAPGFIDVIRSLVGGLHDRLDDLHSAVGNTHAAVDSLPGTVAAAVAVEQAFGPDVKPKGFVLSESMTNGGGGSAGRPVDMSKYGPPVDQAAANAQREDGVKPKGFVLSEDAPKVPRIEDLEGPKIADWVSVYAPDMMSHISNIIEYWAKHPEADPVPGAGYRDSLNAIRAHLNLSGQDLVNAQAQDMRNFENTQSGKYFDGAYPIAGVTLVDMYYLGRMNGQYHATTGRDVYKDILYGSVDAVNAKIQEAGELHAPEMQAFDVSAYHGPLEAIVTNRMNGL